MRDTQRKRVWNVTYAMRDTGEPLPSTDDVRRFLKRAWAMQRVQDAWPSVVRRPMPEIHTGCGHRSCWGWRDEIGVPKWSRTTPIVTALIAQCISKREHPKAANHGPEYCMIYLRLTLYLEGREAHDRLKAAFKVAKVRCTPPRKGKPLSPERRMAAITALAEHQRRKSTAGMGLAVLAARDGMV